MTADQSIALASVLLVGLIALLSLVGWGVSILIKIQTDLARLGAEMVAFQGRLTRIEKDASRLASTVGRCE